VADGNGSTESLPLHNAPVIPWLFGFNPIQWWWSSFTLPSCTATPSIPLPPVLFEIFKKMGPVSGNAVEREIDRF
jgi:hypothetical protein